MSAKIWSVVLLALGSGAAASAQSTITVRLSETSEAFRNPLKGFRPSRYIHSRGWPVWSGNEYVSVFKQYIAYTDLETEPADSVAKIVAWSNAQWAALPGANQTVIPRVVIDYPHTGQFWARGIPAGDWNSPILRDRLVAMIAKLGRAWDRDPRVAAVELGLWGHWGEHHIFPAKPDRIPPAFQRAMGDAAVMAFPNKKVMVRYPETFRGYPFGEYWDSFALPNDAAGGEGEIANGNWRTAYETGEVAYDWGDQSPLGGSPNGTLESAAHTRYVISWIQRCHTSSLGWIAEYDRTRPQVEANAAAMQKQLGYRFVLRQASFPLEAEPGGPMTVAFTVCNVANAPFYYRWPVQAALLDGRRRVMWSGQFDADIRTWEPGQTHDVEATFRLSGPLAAGTYSLALTILDPAGSLPAVRFANTHYYRGGWTPVGKVGIGAPARDQHLAPFDDLKTDRTLHYVAARERL